MPSLVSPRRPHWVWMLVFMLHAAGLILLAQRQGTHGAPLMRERLVVWLLQPKPKLPTATPVPAHAMPRAERPAAAPPFKTILEPAPAAAPRAAVPEEPGATPRGSVAPLQLALPAGPAASQAWRNPALADERSNSPRASVEQRIARAIGGEADQPDEIHGPTRRRIRYRGGCYDVQQSRDAQLDPFNASVKQAPAQLKPCSW